MGGVAIPAPYICMCVCFREATTTEIKIVSKMHFIISFINNIIVQTITYNIYHCGCCQTEEIGKHSYAQLRTYPLV